MIETIKEKLLDAGINPASSIEYDVNGTLHVTTLQEIAEQYLQASEASQRIFVDALDMALIRGEPGVKSYFEKMGKLFLLSHLSEHFPRE